MLWWWIHVQVLTGNLQYSPKNRELNLRAFWTRKLTITYWAKDPDHSYTIFNIGIPYPLKTPRTKLSMKNDPITISGMKNTQLKALPRASFVCKSYRSFRIYNLEMLTVDSPSTLLVSILPWSHIEKLSASPAQCCQKMWFLKYCQFYDHYTGCRGTNIHLYWARPTSPDILTHYAWYYDMQ